MKKKTTLLLIGIFLMIGLAAGAFFWAEGMFSSNYAYRSPLKENPPAPGSVLGDAVSRQMVIVLVDGLRVDTAANQAVMPHLNELRNLGASAVMHSRAPSFSEAGYSTLMIGAWPEINDGPIFNLEYDQIPTWTQDNLFSAAHRKGVQTAVSGYYWFEKLLPPQDVDLHFYTPKIDRTADQDVLAAALPWLQADDAGLVLIHLDQVDFAGHDEGGPKSNAWNEAAARVDTMLGQIAEELDLTKDTLVIVSDHGHIDAGGHGGQEAVVLTEPFIMAGAGVVPGEYRDIQMVDVAPTIAALLGTSLPASTQGEVLTFMLNLPQEVIQELPAAGEKQQTALVRAYANRLGLTIDDSKLPTGSNVASYQAYMDQLRDDRVLVQRVERAALAAILLALAVFLLLRNVRNGSLWWIAAGLVFMGIFNYRYAFWDQLTYSVSSITGETEFILYTVVTAAIAFLISWLIAALGKRTFWQKPLDAALSTVGITLSMIFIAGLPVIFSFVLNGVLVTWTLPDYGTSFPALLGLVQILTVAVCGLMAIGVTAILAQWGHRRQKEIARERKK